MQITKENLIADRQAFVEQLKGVNLAISYIDQLLTFLDKPEEAEVLPEPPIEDPKSEGEA